MNEMILAPTLMETGRMAAAPFRRGQESDTYSFLHLTKMQRGSTFGTNDWLWRVP